MLMNVGKGPETGLREDVVAGTTSLGLEQWLGHCWNAAASLDGHQPTEPRKLPRRWHRPHGARAARFLPVLSEQP